MDISSRRVRILRLGATADEAGYNLVITLNSVQNHFEFVADDRVLPLPSLSTSRSAVNAQDLLDLAASECRSRFPDEYPIVITGVRLREDYSSSFNTEAAVVTTYVKAKAAPNFTLQRYLIYHLVDILMTRYVDLPWHDVATGCVSDELDVTGKMTLGIAKCEYCASCRRRIIAASSTGRITLGQAAAIFRLLDFAAGRRRCFVLMPFTEDFNDVYRLCVKPTLVEAGWICTRADEIFQTREIMSIVWEEILRADLIVAELTHRNANVYYELGFAHALNVNTILLTQDVHDVPFDLRHRQLIVYSPSRTGYGELRRAIREYL